MESRARALLAVAIMITISASITVVAAWSIIDITAESAYIDDNIIIQAYEEAATLPFPYNETETAKLMVLSLRIDTLVWWAYAMFFLAFAVGLVGFWSSVSWFWRVYKKRPTMTERIRQLERAVFNG